jgi:acylpyruvate hydrolase
VKLATVKLAKGLTRAGRVEGDEIVLLPIDDVGQLLASGDGWAERAWVEGPRILFGSAELGRLISRPETVVCVGRSFRDGFGMPDRRADTGSSPELFAMARESVVGPLDDIPLPAGSECVACGADLVVVVGAMLREANESEAKAAIAGFTVGNDVRVGFRSGLPHSTSGDGRGSWEATLPVGPLMVTADELGLQPDGRLTCATDEEVVHESRTSAAILGPVALVAYVSQFTTLLPGDLIFAGVEARPRLGEGPVARIRPGQILTARIDGIGTLANRCVVRRPSQSED